MTFRWIVLLEPGCWITDGEGDPPRTLQRANAREFRSTLAAEQALEKARVFRKFALAKIYKVKASNREFAKRPADPTPAEIERLKEQIREERVDTGRAPVGRLNIHEIKLDRRRNGQNF